MASLRGQVLGGYRRLLRASRQAFCGDEYAIQQARVALREHVFTNKNEANSKVIVEMLHAMEDAENMLLHNIVQGKQTEESKKQNQIKYEVKLTDPQKKNMRKNEEIIPITPTSAEEPLVVNSGNVCQRG
jgi:complex III assembly factor LYRM7